MAMWISIPATAASPSKVPRAIFGCIPATDTSKPATSTGVWMPIPATGTSRLTGDGSIDARVEPGSKLSGGWSIRTGDGSVDLVLPADLQASIDASTNDGHISLG